jgi:hypothetical protein
MASRLGCVRSCRAAAATTDTASSVLVQVQQAAAANGTLVNTVFQNAKAQPGGNFAAAYEGQLLGGQILFQQDIDAVINSFPSSVSDENESNPVLLPRFRTCFLSNKI